MVCLFIVIVHIRRGNRCVKSDTLYFQLVSHLSPPWCFTTNATNTNALTSQGIVEPFKNFSGHVEDVSTIWYLSL